MSHTRGATETTGHWVARYTVRTTFFLSLLVAFNAALLILQYNLADAILVNFVAGSIMLFLSSYLGDSIDKKLTLWSFRIYRWLLRNGLVEEAL